MNQLADPIVAHREQVRRGIEHVKTFTKHPPARDDLIATVREMVKAAFDWGWEAGQQEAQRQLGAEL